MLFFKSLSIKWKIGCAIIISGLLLVSLYILLAKNVFENDKISYVYDVQSYQVKTLKDGIGVHLEKSILVSQAIIAHFDPATQKVSVTGEKIFQDQKDFVALDVVNDQTKQVIFKLEKPMAPLLPPSNLQKINPNEISTELIGRDLLALTYLNLAANQTQLRIRIVVRTEKLLPAATASQALALIYENQILQVSSQNEVNPNVLNQVIQSDNINTAEKTFLLKSGTEKYLVSLAATPFKKLKVISITPEAEALGALGTLFKRSVIFFIFSGFALVLISITLAHSLTSDLSLLTRAAGEIGKGRFDQIQVPDSKDEIGILSHAFKRMTAEIKQLLVRTREKDRMEAELQTARLIQERLLPQAPSCSIGEIEVSGAVKTSSECGGDWWYYFQKGDDLFIAIADATGHGTGAALITAAARSIFSRFETDELSLQDMMQAWDSALFACSQGKVFMTGVLIRVNTKTGKGSFINSAHEWPFYIKKTGTSTFAVERIESPSTYRIGTQTDFSNLEIPFELNQGEYLVLFTDGLTSVERPDGKVLSEVRFGRSIAKQASTLQSAKNLLDYAFQVFEEHLADNPMPDDLAFVSIRRKDSQV